MYEGENKRGIYDEPTKRIRWKMKREKKRASERTLGGAPDRIY